MIWPKRRVIDDQCAPELGPMMIRYFILRTGPVHIYLHHFLRSDNDRHFHDHPWSFLAFILTRGYWEHVPEGRSWRRRFSLLYRPATWKHWVEIDKPCWTLIFTWGRRRQWGFWTEKGWVDWITYGKEWCD